MKIILFLFLADICLSYKSPIVYSFFNPGNYILNPYDYMNYHNVLIEMWGAGASGDNCYGFGGASGAYLKASFQTGLEVFNLTIGRGGSGSDKCGGVVNGISGGSTNFININSEGGVWKSDKISYGGNNTYTLSNEFNGTILCDLHGNGQSGEPISYLGLGSGGSGNNYITIGSSGGSSPFGGIGGNGVVCNYFKASRCYTETPTSDGIMGGGGGGAMAYPCYLQQPWYWSSSWISMSGNGGDGRINLYFY